ncbi:MAG: TIGR00341 family protein [Haloarculaceae archaeon]
MRLVQVTIPSGKRETLLGALEDADVDFVVSDETGSREIAAVAYVPLPTNAVEPILEELREAGLSDEDYTVVLEATTVVSRSFDELQERYAEDEEAEDRIAREELTAAAEELAPTGWTYGIMTLISAVIATAGLLLDSPAVVVGSMVIAPLVGPALSASVGTVVNDSEMFRTGAKLQLVGVVLAVAGATAFAFAVKYGQLVPPFPDVISVPEIAERIAPDFLSLAVAIGAGAAGVISLMTGISTALVGVMIAAALIPPAATVGIAIAWGEPLAALGAGVLVLVNLLSINLAALVVLWNAGYRPEHWFREDQARRTTLQRIAALVVAIIVLSTFLGGVTVDSMQRAQIENDLREDAAAVVDAGGDGVDLTLLDVEVTRTNRAVFQEVERLTVTVGVPPGESVSGLAGRLDERADATAGTDVDVQVRYVTSEGTR